MSWEYLLAKMTARGVPFLPSGAGEPEITQQDVAQMLGGAVVRDDGTMRKLDRLTYLWARFLYCDDKAVLVELVELLCRAMMREVIKGFYTTPDFSLTVFEGLARLAIAERVVFEKRVCSSCGGNEKKNCRPCGNTRVKKVTLREREKLSGISKSTFHRNRERYLEIVDMGCRELGSCESKLSRHIWAKMGFAA